MYNSHIPRLIQHWSESLGMRLAVYHSSLQICINLGDRILDIVCKIPAPYSKDPLQSAFHWSHIHPVEKRVSFSMEY